MSFEDGGDVKVDGCSEGINHNADCSKYWPECVICVESSSESNGVVGFGFGRSCT